MKKECRNLRLSQVFSVKDDKSIENERGSSMKLLSTIRNRMRANLINNKKGQGATEYILLLVVIVGLVIAFGPKIKTMIGDKTKNLGEAMDKVQAE